MNYLIKFLLLFSLISLITSCKTGSEKTNTWLNELKIGMTIDQVEKYKPDNVTIYWNNPVVTDSITKEYDLKYEDGRDFAPIPYYLVFVNEKYILYSGRN